MFNQQVAKIKAVFVCAVACMIVVMVGGIYYLIKETPAMLSFYKRQQASVSYVLRYGPSEGAQVAAVFMGASRSAAPPSAGATEAQAIPVLLYHGENGSADVPTERFIEQMKALKAAGWQTVTLEEFEDFMSGKRTLPARSFLLTFDDGRKQTFYDVDPVLKDSGYTAVMYVITGFSLPDNGDKAINDFYLNKAELSYMAKSGRWELESHGDQDHRTYSVPTATSTAEASSTIANAHFLSSKFWMSEQNRVETDEEYKARVTNDLMHAKETLAQDFGRTVTTFAFPFSDIGETSVNVSQAQEMLSAIVPRIYRYAFYQVSPQHTDPFNMPNTDAFLVKRFEPQQDWSGADLVRLLEQMSPKSLPYQSVLEADWRGNWGQVQASGSALLMGAEPTTTGACALIAGSGLWDDYTASAEVRVTGGREVTLVARYQNDDNKIYCTFLNDGVELVQYAGGLRRVLSGAHVSTAPIFNGGATLSMSVVGTYASCSINGKIVAGTDALDPRLRVGSAGLQTWDQRSGVADIAIRSYSAQPANGSIRSAINAFLRR